MIATPAADSRRRVLVVDDNEDGAEMLAHVMAAQGHRVRVAHDGVHAQQIACDFQPDVALLDIGLPNMDGYELAKQLRSQAAGRPMRLVALTGYAMDATRSREAGFDFHVLKPPNLEDIEGLVAGAPSSTRSSGIFVRVTTAEKPRRSRGGRGTS